MNVDIIIDFLIFCSIIYFLSEFIKRRYYNLSKSVRYDLFIRHLARHLSEINKPLPSSILYWSDETVECVKSHFTQFMPKMNFTQRYLYIFFAANAAITINLAPVILKDHPTIGIIFIGTFITLLFVSAVSRLFLMLDIIMTQNVISLLMPTEDNEGLIIPAASKLNQRHHKSLLNGDLFFLESENANKR